MATTSLVRYRSSGSTLVADLYDLGLTLMLKAKVLQYWLRYAAPTIVRAQIVQLGFHGIDRIPLISPVTRRALRRMLLDGLLG